MNTTTIEKLAMWLWFVSGGGMLLRLIWLIFFPRKAQPQMQPLRELIWDVRLYAPRDLMSPPTIHAHMQCDCGNRIEIAGSANLLQNVPLTVCPQCQRNLTEAFGLLSELVAEQSALNFSNNVQN